MTARPSSQQAPGRRALLTREILLAGVTESFRKLDPRVQVRNPVMFVVFVGSVLTTAIGVAAAFGLRQAEGGAAFVLSISAWLWLTVLFANFAEAVAEGRTLAAFGIANPTAISSVVPVYLERFNPRGQYAHYRNS